MTQFIHATTPIVTVDEMDVDCQFIPSCLEDPDNKYRFCAHLKTTDPIHEMIISHTDKTIVPIHKHHNKTESFHWIKGCADVLIYGDDGVLTNTIKMGAYETGRVFYYRLNADLYHSLKIWTPVVVFHEVTPGPWRKEDLILAPWWQPPAGWSR